MVMLSFMLFRKGVMFFTSCTYVAKNQSLIYIFNMLDHWLNEVFGYGRVSESYGITEVSACVFDILLYLCVCVPFLMLSILLFSLYSFSLFLMFILFN